MAAPLKGLFVTGVGVGKTEVAAALIHETTGLVGFLP